MSAFRFTAALTSYLETITLNRSYPITLACWAWVDSAGDFALMSIGDPAGTARLQLNASSVSGGKLQATTVNTSGSSNSASSSAAIPVGVWFHAAAVFVGAADRRVFLNGARTNSTSSISGVIGITTLSVGTRYASGARGAYLNGKVFWPATWNATLSDEEIGLLAAGWSPELIQPRLRQDFYTERSGGGFIQDRATRRTLINYSADALNEIPPQVAVRMPRRVARTYSFPSGAGGIAGTASITEAGDTIGASAAATVAAALAVTESDDTLVSTSAALIAATLSANEADDTLAGTIGNAPISATASITEGSDTLVSSGSAAIKGALAATESDDTVSSTGVVLVKADAALTESDDTLSAQATGQSVVVAALAVTEADDTLAATAAARIAGTFAVTESDDVAAASSSVLARAALDVVEADDAVSTSGAARIAAQLAATESDDTLVATGQVIAAGALVATASISEADDTAEATATVVGFVLPPPGPVYPSELAPRRGSGRGASLRRQVNYWENLRDEEELALILAIIELLDTYEPENLYPEAA